MSTGDIIFLTGLGITHAIQTLAPEDEKVPATIFDENISRHAFKRVIERNISDAEIRQAGVQASIIEDYPDDKYAPSSLLLGFTITGRPMHIQAFHVDSDLLKIITIYVPDPAE